MPILELPIFELVECQTDANGNIVYEKHNIVHKNHSVPDLAKVYYEYDNKGTMNAKRTVRGPYEHIEKYDDKSQLIHELILEVGKDDKEYHYAYHGNGFKSYDKNPTGERYYDERGNLLKYRYDENSEVWFDPNGFRIGA